MPIDQATPASTDERRCAVKLVAYARVSTEGQARDGYGLEAQRRAIRDWARTARHRIVAWHPDAGYSGTLDAAARCGLTEALATLADGMAVGLVVRDLDRIGRTLRPRRPSSPPYGPYGATASSPAQARCSPTTPTIRCAG